MRKWNKFLCILLCILFIFSSTTNVFAANKKDKEGYLNELFELGVGEFLGSYDAFGISTLFDWIPVIMFIENLPVGDGPRNPGPKSVTAKVRKVNEFGQKVEEKYEKFEEFLEGTLDLFNGNDIVSEAEKETVKTMIQDEKKREIIEKIQNSDIEVETKIAIVKENIILIDEMRNQVYESRGIARIKPGESIEVFNGTKLYPGYLDIKSAYANRDFKVDFVDYNDKGEVKNVVIGADKRTFLGVLPNNHAVITNKDNVDVYLIGTVGGIARNLETGKLEGGFVSESDRFNPKPVDEQAVNEIVLNKGDSLVYTSEQMNLVRIKGNCQVNGFTWNATSTFTRTAKKGYPLKVIANEDNVVISSGSRVFNPIVNRIEN